MGDKRIEGCPVFSTFIKLVRDFHHSSTFLELNLFASFLEQTVLSSGHLLSSLLPGHLEFRIREPQYQTLSCAFPVKVHLLVAAR